MPQRTHEVELGRLGLTSGEGRTLELSVPVEPFDLAGSTYAVEPRETIVRLDISRTTGQGYALRLRFAAAVTGTCMRCLDPATPTFSVDAREVDQPGTEADELSSPYVDAEEVLDLSRWAHDSLALALPTGITCRPDCRGLCPECGENLNEWAGGDPNHEHERPPDPRWGALSEIKFD
jgi:uncharacterized protein